MAGLSFWLILKKYFPFCVCVCILCFWKFACDTIFMWSDLAQCSVYSKGILDIIFEKRFTLTKNAIRAKHKKCSIIMTIKKKFKISDQSNFDFWALVCALPMVWAVFCMMTIHFHLLSRFHISAKLARIQMDYIYKYC